MRKVTTSFEIFSQPAGLVGKPNQPIHWFMFVGTSVLVLWFVFVGSWSFGVGIALALSCWIPDTLRKVMTSFEIFSQPAGPVGLPNQPIHWVTFSETASWVVY